MSLSKEIEDFARVYSMMSQARQRAERSDRANRPKPSLFDIPEVGDAQRNWQGPAIPPPGQQTPSLSPIERGANGSTGAAKAGSTTAASSFDPSKAPSFLAQTAAKYGIDPDYMTRTAWIESKFNPNAKAGSSSAGGLFQFTNDTAKRYGLTNKFDGVANADAAARLALDNQKALQKVLGRAPTGAELYLAHQQGAGGAAQLLNNPNTPAIAIVGRDAVVNNGGNSNMTAQQFANLWLDKYNGLGGGGSHRGPTQDAGGGPVKTAEQAIPLPPKRDIPSAPAYAPQEQSGGFNKFLEQQTGPNAVKQGVSPQGAPVDQGTGLPKQTTGALSDVPQVAPTQVAPTQVASAQSNVRPIESSASADAPDSNVRPTGDLEQGDGEGPSGGRPRGILGLLSQLSFARGGLVEGPQMVDDASASPEPEPVDEEPEGAIPLPPARPASFGRADVPTPPARPADLAPAPQAPAPQQQAPQDDNPIAMLFDGIGEALNAGINGLQQMFGMQAQGAVPNNPGASDSLRQWFSGAGSASAQDVQTLGKMVDPQNRLTEGMRTAAGMNAAYRYYLERGEPQKAQKVAQSIIQYSRMLASTYADEAVKLFQRGDTAGGVAALKKAQDAVPDGTSADAQPLQDGSFAVTQKDARGRVVQQARVTPQQIFAAAVGLRDGSAYWSELGKAASGGQAGYKEEAQPSEAFTRWQEGSEGGATPAGAIPTAPTRPSTQEVAAPSTGQVAGPGAPVTPVGNAPAQFSFDEPAPAPLPSREELAGMSKEERALVIREHNVQQREWQRRRNDAEKTWRTEQNAARSETAAERRHREKIEQDRMISDRNEAQFERGQGAKKREGRLKYEAPEKITQQNAEQYAPEALDAALGITPEDHNSTDAQHLGAMRQVMASFKRFNHFAGYGDEQYAGAVKQLITPSPELLSGQKDETSAPYTVELMPDDEYNRVRLKFNSGEEMYLPEPAFMQAMKLRGLAVQEARAKGVPAPQGQRPPAQRVQGWRPY